MAKLKVGITGGIGSGKTTVGKIFETLGIPVYYADDRAKALMIEDDELILGVKTLFGNEAYYPDGALNRKYIADIAFHNPLILNQLNALVHPAVLKDGIRWHNEQPNVPYTLKEAALLFESDSYKYLDKIITVFAPQHMRLERIVKRSAPSPAHTGTAMTKASIEARMAKQLPEEEKMKRADFIIYNDGQQALIPQVLKIHQKLCEISKAFIG